MFNLFKKADKNTNNQKKSATLQNVKEYLPIGSVVLLKNGESKVMIYGIKQTTSGNDEYDYIGVLYPEGNLGDEYTFLFNHQSIDKVFFRGYEDEEREAFIESIADFYNET